MTKQDIDNIIHTICPSDEDFDKPCISPAYLKKELEALALEQEPYFWEKCPYYEPDIMFDGKDEYDMGKCTYKQEPNSEWISELVDGEDWKGCKRQYYQPISCSKCHSPNHYKSAYCPNCGARMEGEE